MAQHFTGLVAPVYTPMGDDGTLNLAMVERQAAALVADGVSGAFVCGGTGESLSLSVAERKTLVRRWCEVAGDALPVIAHVGHLCLPDALEITRDAAAAGAKAIAAVPPCYFKPQTPRDLVEWAAVVAAAAPDLPFYYYHVPASTGVVLPMIEVLALSRDRIPNLAGMKFTYEDFMDLRLCTALDGGRYNILFGREEMLLAGLVTGCQGSVSTSYNYAAPLHLRIYNAYMAGDLATAQAEQLRAAELVRVLRRVGVAWKAVMRLIGIDCGQPRLPQRAYSDADLERLRAALDDFGFFDDCAGGGP